MLHKGLHNSNWVQSSGYELQPRQCGKATVIFSAQGLADRHVQSGEGVSSTEQVLLS